MGERANAVYHCSTSWYVYQEDRTKQRRHTDSDGHHDFWHLDNVRNRSAIEWMLGFGLLERQHLFEVFHRKVFRRVTFCFLFFPILGNMISVHCAALIFLAIMMPNHQRSLKNPPCSVCRSSLDRRPLRTLLVQTPSEWLKIDSRESWVTPFSCRLLEANCEQMENTVTLRKCKLCDHLRFLSILLKVLEGWNCKTRTKFI